MPEERFKIRADVGLFLLKNNQIFLIRRKNTGWGDGLWAIPAGHIEEGETATQSAVRECEEEAGVKVSATDLQPVQAIHRKSDDNVVFATFIFVAKKWQGEPYCAEQGVRADKADWFPLDKLPDNTAEYVKKAIENYKNNIYYSELGWDK